MTIVTNPNLAFQSVTDPSSWLDADNRFIGPLYYQRIIPVYASAAVNAGDAVSLVAPTTTNPLSVAPSTTVATDSYRGLGVARSTVSAGETCDVIIQGVAVVNVGTQDCVFGDIATFTCTGTAGIPTFIAQASWAATNFAKSIGFFLSADDTPSLGGVAQTTKAVIWVDPSL